MWGKDFLVIWHSFTMSQLRPAEENCWDAVICFGHPSIGFGSSLVLLFLLIFTVFLQLVFCYMVYTSFTENPFETLGKQCQQKHWQVPDRTAVACVPYRDASHGTEGCGLECLVDAAAEPLKRLKPGKRQA
eukprot:s5348_g2.t1